MKLFSGPVTNELNIFANSSIVRLLIIISLVPIAQTANSTYSWIIQTSKAGAQILASNIPLGVILGRELYDADVIYESLAGSERVEFSIELGENGVVLENQDTLNLMIRGLGVVGTIEVYGVEAPHDEKIAYKFDSFTAPDAALRTIDVMEVDELIVSITNLEYVQIEYKERLLPDGRKIPSKTVQYTLHELYLMNRIVQRKLMYTKTNTFTLSVEEFLNSSFASGYVSHPIHDATKVKLQPVSGSTSYSFFTIKGWLYSVGQAELKLIKEVVKEIKNT